MSPTTLRRVATVTLVLAAVLGSSFAIGHSLMAQLAPPPTGATANVNNTQYADQPPPSPSPSPSPSASPSPSQRNRQPADDGDGPFGAMVTTGTSRVALTFDDGPDPQYTPQVLALLREYRVKATFCVVGENVESHPDLVQAIVSEGHTLCNHSWNHDVSLGDQSPETIRDDLLRTDAAIRAAVPNARVAYYRQPGGAWTRQVVSVAEEMGMIPLHWAVDPVDWQLPGAARITETVLAQTAAGSIVLLHDAGGNRSGTVEALQYLLPELLSRFQLEALPAGTT